LNFAHLAAAMVCLYRWETQPALTHLERAAAISTQEGFAYQRAVGALMEGWALLLQGRPGDAIVRLREALAGHEATGAGIARPGILALLARATGMSGQVDEGLRLVDAGRDDAEQTEQLLHVVQLNVTRGDLLLWRGEVACAAEAEACYRRALDLARTLRTPML